MKYNVGDKVRIQPYEWYLKEIESESWCPNIFDIYWCSREMTISKIEKSYYLMEEDMQEFHWTDEMIEGLVEDETPLDKAGQITDFEYEGLAYTLPDGYIFKDENGNVVNATKIVLEKKKKEYPKTYDACENILGLKDSIIEGCLGYEYKLLNAFQKLLMCRDAYWKIAGDWKLGYPFNTARYVITNSRGFVGKVLVYDAAKNYVLEFPTEEMRDAFYENFKELIEQCKGLL